MPIPLRAKPVARFTARQMVYQRLREWIESGVLAPGETLSDLEIAQRLGVSRTPVREAFQSLDQFGLIVAEPGRVTRVAPLDPRHWRDIHEPLAALEAIAARRAAERRSEADLGRLRAVQGEFQRAVLRADKPRAQQLDAEFHDLLVEIAGNPYLIAPIEALRVQRRRMNSVFFNEIGPRAESVAEHQAILDAVAAGDGEHAAVRVGANWDGSARRVEEVYGASIRPAGS